MSVAGASSGLETDEPGQKGTHGGGRHAQDHGHGQAMVRIFLLLVMLIVMFLMIEMMLMIMNPWRRETRTG